MSCATVPSSATSSEPINCWATAGDSFSIDPWLLYSIGQVESSLNPKAVNYNKDSVDRGIMQINSYWVGHPQLSNITKEDLYDPCINIHIGAYILDESFRIFGRTWNAVGAYNAGTADTEIARKKRIAYSNKVKEQYRSNISRFTKR